jgi:hypothetical protein
MIFLNSAQSYWRRPEGLVMEIPAGGSGDGVLVPGSHGELTSSARRLLQAIYDLLWERSAWPAFRTVDLRRDHDLGIADAQTALADVSAEYLSAPGRWSSRLGRARCRRALTPSR